MSKIVMQDKEFLYENASVPIINKLQDTDINNFKNVINQEGTYTTCTYANSSYSCTLLGTLTAGDTIKILLPLSNQDSSTDSDISISIDGGTTYYNLLDKDKNFNLMASDFDYNDIYLIAVFNGTDFVALSPDRVKNIMILRLSSDYTTPTGLNYYNIGNLTLIEYQRGKRFTKGSITPTGQGSAMPGVKIGAGIDTVKISATAQMQNNNTTSTMYLILYLARCTSAGTQTNLARAGEQNILAGNFTTLSCTETVVNVNTNDIIGLRLYKSASSGIAVVGYENRTYLKVEEV